MRLAKTVLGCLACFLGFFLLSLLIFPMPETVFTTSAGATIFQLSGGILLLATGSNIILNLAGVKPLHVMANSLFSLFSYFSH